MGLSSASPATERPTAAEVRQLIEPVDNPSSERRAAATAFAASVAEIIDMVSKDLVFEVPPEQLARLAVVELFTQSARKLPADLLELLNETRRPAPEQVQALLYGAYLRARPDGDPEALRDRVILGMVRAADASADWVTSPVRICRDLSFVTCGVGLRLETDRASGMARVITPIRNSPADGAGIRAGDVLTEVTLIEDNAGCPLPVPEVFRTRGRTVAEVNAKILGKKGTRVALSIRQDDGSIRTLRLRRAPVALATVVGWRWEDGWDYWLDPQRRIAYVRLTAFRRDTVRNLEAVLGKLEQQGMRGLVLDLRFNEGGLLDSSIRIADLFIADGLICRIWARMDQSRFEGERKGSRLGFPLACLVNGKSRSSCELLAACLQDHKRAAIVGERSRGWARFQNIVPLAGGELLLTTAVFLRPSGRKLDRIPVKGHDEDEWGVSPDPGQAVPLSAAERQRLKEYLDSRDWVLRPDQLDELRHYHDRQREQALVYLRSQISDPSSQRNR